MSWAGDGVYCPSGEANAKERARGGSGGMTEDGAIITRDNGEAAFEDLERIEGGQTGGRAIQLGPEHGQTPFYGGFGPRSRLFEPEPG